MLKDLEITDVIAAIAIATGMTILVTCTYILVGA